MEDSKPPVAAAPQNAQRPPVQPAPGAAPTPPRVQMYTPPATPADVAREKERVAVLLEINRELAAHLGQLQADGHGGEMRTQAQAQAQAQAQSPTTQSHPGGAGSTGGTPPATPTTSTKVASQEYTRCMRCMQANLQYLIATSSQGAKAPVGPAFMEPPVATQRVAELYDKLKALFPGWRGMQFAMQAMAQAQLARKASGDSSAAVTGMGRGAVPGGQAPGQAPMPNTNAGLPAATPGTSTGPVAAMTGVNPAMVAAMPTQGSPVQRQIHTPPSHILSGVQASVRLPNDGTSSPQYQSTNAENQSAALPVEQVMSNQQSSAPLVGQGIPNQPGPSLNLDSQENVQEQGAPSESSGGVASNTFMPKPS